MVRLGSWLESLDSMTSSIVFSYLQLMREIHSSWSTEFIDLLPQYPIMLLTRVKDKFRITDSKCPNVFNRVI